MKIVRTARGGRLLHGEHVVSEVLSAPGATHSVFDVLAAAVAICARGPKLAMLGFAAGGMLAPLRKLGWEGPVEAVDLSLEGVPLFEACRGRWAGEVNIHEGDAVEWLRARRLRWDVVIEDLSQQIPGDVTKPPVSLDELPDLVPSRLSARGIEVINVLPVAGYSWPQLLETITRGHQEVRVVRLESFDNRIVVAGASLPSGRELGTELRARLAAIRSRLAKEITVTKLSSR